MRAALYARFSTEKQSESSIDDQFRVCERIAEREGFTIAARFSDAAISGGTAQRAGYQALLAGAKNREFHVIVTEDSSRLWRELSEQWRALKELQDLGVHVVGHGLDTRREESKILLAVSGAMAEAYRDEIARRTRRGLEGRALAGKATGGRAYGYVPARESTNGEIEINEAQAAVVRRIFELYADGHSPRAIASKLNAEGVPSPGANWNRSERRTDAKWLASAIHGDTKRATGILNNARYTGVVAWGRSQWKRGAADSSKRRMTLKDSAHVRTDARLRIVSDELWQRVKARQVLQSRSAGERVKTGLSRRRPGKYLLTGLLRCAACEASFQLSNSTRYQCASHHNGGDSACAVSLSVPRLTLEQVILNCVHTDLLNPERLAELERRFTVAQPARVDTSALLAKLTKQERNLTAAIADGGDIPALLGALKEVQAERAKLQAVSGVAPLSAARTGFTEPVERRAERMRARLAQGGEVARNVLAESVPAVNLARGRMGPHVCVLRGRSARRVVRRSRAT